MNKLAYNLDPLLKNEGLQFPSTTVNTKKKNSLMIQRISDRVHGKIPIRKIADITDFTETWYIFTKRKPTYYYRQPSPKFLNPFTCWQPMYMESKWSATVLPWAFLSDGKWSPIPKYTIVENISIREQIQGTIMTKFEAWEGGSVCAQ
jgi:hypothetical protein